MRRRSAMGIDAALYMLHSYRGIPLSIQTPKGTTNEVQENQTPETTEEPEVQGIREAPVSGGTPHAKT